LQWSDAFACGVGKALPGIFPARTSLPEVASSYNLHQERAGKLRRSVLARPRVPRHSTNPMTGVLPRVTTTPARPCTRNTCTQPKVARGTLTRTFSSRKWPAGPCRTAHVLLAARVCAPRASPPATQALRLVSRANVGIAGRSRTRGGGRPARRVRCHRNPALSHGY
jgi:hypothetical protein